MLLVYRVLSSLFLKKQKGWRPHNLPAGTGRMLLGAETAPSSGWSSPSLALHGECSSLTSLGALHWTGPSFISVLLALGSQNRMQCFRCLTKLQLCLYVLNRSPCWMCNCFPVYHLLQMSISSRDSRESKMNHLVLWMSGKSFAWF